MSDSESAKDLRPESPEQNGHRDESPAPIDSDANDDVRDAPPDDDNDSDVSDNESVLSDIDEALIQDFDPSRVNVEDPVAVDETNVALLGVHKRKRAEGEEAPVKKKKKEGRREKKIRRRTDDDGFVGGEQIEGSRRERKKKTDGERARARVQKEVETDEETLTPEERRKRALDKKMDEALKSSSRRGKQSGLDFEAMIDREIENMRGKMIEAAKADAEAREAGKPATHKLQLLPEVIGLLNRDKFGSELVDPDINLLEAVRFFLEPLADGSLPAYQIQKQLFDVLERLPIKTESLSASGIGKVTQFYTKSKRPQADIKRQADRLVAAWTRPILRRNADFRKRDVQEVQYDPNRLPYTQSADLSADLQAKAAARRREQMLATPTYMNRARMEHSSASYTIAPRSSYVPAQTTESGGGDVVKRIIAKHTMPAGKVSRKR